LSIQSYDDYFENTMFGMFLRDDNPYTLDFSKWVMRLSHGYGQLTSNSSTNLKFGGPGALQLFTGNVLRSILNADGTLSIYNPIYSETSTNPESISFSSVASSMNSGTYNYIINASNNTGTKLVVFVNGSTRTTDNGTNSVTIRNDGGNLYLGNSGSTTYIYNRSDVSDETYKENIVGYHGGLNLIKTLQPKQFNFIGNSRTQYGFIAQDIEDEKVVIPGYEGNPWSVDYNSIIAALVSANKELAERVEALENK
jgi:predicted small secreted protein